MSDNVTRMEPEQPSGHRGLWKKIVVFAVIVAAVCGLVALILFSDGLNLDSLRRWVKYMNVSGDGSYGVYSFDSHSSNRYESFGDGLAVASVSGLTVFGEQGEELFTMQKQMALPQLQVRGDLAVAYDVGGGSLLALHRKNGEVLRLEENRAILDADLSDGGYLCISSSASGYKSVLSVYNNSQNLIYRWLSSTTYIPLCSVSADGRWLSAVGLGQSGGAFESSLLLFRTDSDDIQRSVSLGSQLIYDLMFVGDKTICAVGETSVQFLSLEGELLGSYAYEDRYLKDFTDGGDGFLTLAVNMYRAGNRYSLVTVDEKGRELASVYLGQEILDLSACGRYIAALTPEGLTVYTQSLSVYAETADTGSATSVVMRKDGSVLLLGNGQGKLYLP